MNCYRMYELCKKRTAQDEKAEYEIERAKEKRGRFFDDPEYTKYVAKNGPHFTDSLAEYASGLMDNAKGEPSHHWDTEDVKGAFSRMGLGKPEGATWGDITYSANMAYADYYGSSLTTEAECLKQAFADAADPDGYPGKIFNRWLADVMGKGERIDWAKYA